MADWQTGSSNVLFKLVERYVIGIIPEYNGACISPATWQPFSSFTLTTVLRDCTITISYSKSSEARRF